MIVDPRPVLTLVGKILCGLAGTMLIPAAFDWKAGHEEWQAFTTAAFVTALCGLALALGMRMPRRTLSIRQAYLTAAACWVVPTVFAALPFLWGATQLPLVDGWFEAVSGITGTASTVLAGLDRLPPGLLLWRGLLQWMGGIGMVVMAVAVLPALNVGGMQMFRIEVISANDRATPRAARIGSTIVGVYVALTVTLYLALWAAGMGRFEALVHAMTTLSTGGFSTRDAQLAHFDRATIDLVVAIGMVVGGLPFLMFSTLAQGDWRRVIRNQQVHWYLGLMLLGALAVTLWLVNSRGYGTATAIRYGFFTVASVMTGTGLTTIDFSDWAGMPVAILFLLTFVGGCSGSTAAGIKVFRFQFLFANALMQVRQLLRPHAVLVPTFNHKPIAKEVLGSVMGFLFVYALSFAVLAMLLALLGLDFVTALSASASAISNLGLGLGEVIGPGGTYAPLDDLAKLLLAGGMLLGRLEMFILLVLVVPAFWED
jgi:trk system potassium uptake protein TrkH